MSKKNQKLSENFQLWYENNKRELPWRSVKEPYFIWISEIILQQTRVAQGLDYYLRFIKRFPDLPSLSMSSETEVLKAWEGLGYYSRARNILKTAKILQKEYHGSFPRSVQELEKLPGIGPYTAAAIASICFGSNDLAIDGNVVRVLSRIFGVYGVRSKKGFLRELKERAKEIEFVPYSDLNQALMDLGSSICTPLNPNCEECPLTEGCFARISDKIHELPVPESKPKTRKRYFHYLVIENDEGLVLSRRDEKDIWANMFDFPYLETENPTTSKEILEKLGFEINDLNEETGYKKHILSHQQIFANFLILRKGMSLKTNQISEDRETKVYSTLKNLPLPRIITNFLEEREIEYGWSQ